MSANVDTMFYNYANREKPWHGLGVAVPDALTSAEALATAGLDWNVIKHPVMDETLGVTIPGYLVNVRDKDNAILGIVSNRYQIVQNRDAFDFTDSLIGDEVRYETAGSLRNGKTIWLLAKMPETKILDDEVEPYMCFANSHDGTGAIKVCMTPVRVVCNNTLNLAMGTAKRVWSTRHMGDISTKLEEARETLQLANTYMTSLSDEAEILAVTHVDMTMLEKLLQKMFPINTEDSDRKKKNMRESQDTFYQAYLAPDLANYKNTAWGIVNAAADFAGHTAPARMTASYNENNWGKIMTGHDILDKTYSFVRELV